MEVMGEVKRKRYLSMSGCRKSTFKNEVLLITSKIFVTLIRGTDSCILPVSHAHLRVSSTAESSGGFELRHRLSKLQEHITLLP